jgi:hypothetical protein
MLTLDDLINEDPSDPMVNSVQTLSEKIKQRRTQMLIHSYLYYTLDDTVITDDKWQQWADELTELQKRKSNIGFYDKEFSDWNGSTGMHLPSPAWIVNKAKKLLTSKDK